MKEVQIENDICRNNIWHLKKTFAFKSAHAGTDENHQITETDGTSENGLWNKF